MRSMFDTTMDVTSWVDYTAAPPGTPYLIAEPCRFVLRQHIFRAPLNYQLAAGYVTAMPILAGPTNILPGPGAWDFRLDLSSSDFVSIPSGVPPNYIVSALEGVFAEPTFVTLLYVRMWVIAYPNIYLP